MLESKKIKELMDHAHEMQNNMEKAKEQLSQLSIEATSNDKAVKVVMNGNKVLENIFIDSSISSQIEIIKDNIIEAINKVLIKADQASSEKMIDYLATFASDKLVGLNI